MSTVLEIRQTGSGRRLYGRFPYGSEAVIANTGSVRKERFAPGAFDFAINTKTRPIDILVGHSFDRPLASRGAGTLEIASTSAAVEFEATLPDDAPSWVLDAEKAIAAGLMVGLSPGFFVPPKSVVPDAEQIMPEPGNPGVQIREIRAAVLREMSVVTNPAYPDAGLDLRSLQASMANSESGWQVESVVTRPHRLTLWL